MLHVSHLSSGYGHVPVVRDISFEVAPGEVLLIGGENGAGKSTLLQTIAGFVKPSAGSVRLAGADITTIAVEARVTGGLRLVLDGHRVFPEMSVFDNLRLGASPRLGKAEFATRVGEIYASFPILRDRRLEWARNLSGGQQQMLALGQAFLSCPKVLLCDEPSLGLAHALMPQVTSFLRRLAGAGTAVVVVEQMLDLALPIADRVMLIHRGSVARIQPASELRDGSRTNSRAREQIRQKLLNMV